MATPSGTPSDATLASSPVAPHRPLADFYTSSSQRASFVRGLFDQSAPYYDKLSAILSFGSDRHYRKMVLRNAGLKPNMRLLDVATGTGLVARAALDLGVPPENIIGLDPSWGMLEENRKRQPICLVQAKGEQLPLASNRFDFVTMGYALRHVDDLRHLFLEFHRVLKPGGTAIVLELSRPNSKVICALMRTYFSKILPVVLRCLTGRAAPARLMQYYWATIAECVPPSTIVEALQAAGFAKVERQHRGGILNDYYGRKQ